MTGWKARRFWTEVEVTPEEGGFGVALDGRKVRTPGARPLLLPTRALAEAVAEEWRKAPETIDPLGMPLTRLANSAIEKVAPQRAEVAAMLAAYGETDLLCYRAEGPEDLVRRQVLAWDPWLDWVAERYRARLAVGTGVVPVRQSPEALRPLAEAVEALDPFRLGAFHDLVALSGSLVLALAVVEGVIETDEAWGLSRLDEDWQAELWGRDEEAESAAAERQQAFRTAARAIRLLASD